jgi:hypothetical protein
MTIAQAKAVLIAYRPGTDDATDPDVAAALALCRQDVALADWWASQQAHQQVLRAKFATIPVPHGLAEQIISERKVQFSLPRWRQPVMLAAGCAVVLLVGISVWFAFQATQRPDVSFDGYRARMVKTALRVYGMDLETNDAAQIRAFLAEQNAPADYELPAALGQTETVGCGVLRWQDKPVSMICFRTGQPLPPGGKTDLMLFVIRKADLQGDIPRVATEIVGISHLSTAAWQVNDKVYLLAAFDATELQKRL